MEQFVARGKASGSAGAYLVHVLECTVNSQSTTNNSSNVTLHAYAYATSNSAGAYNLAGNAKSTTFYIKNGVTTTAMNRNQNMDFRNQATVDLGSVTFNVTHDSNGQMSLWVQNDFDTNGPSSIKKGSVGATWQLPTIQRDSSPTVSTGCPTFTGRIGEQVSFGTNMSANWYTIQLEFGGLTRYLGTDGNLYSAQQNWTSPNFFFNVPTSYYNYFSGASAKGNIKMWTWGGSAGNTISTNTFTINADKYVCAPQISPRIVDENPNTLALTGNSNIIIQSYSEAWVRPNIIRNSNPNDGGATIKSILINNMSVSASASKFKLTPPFATTKVTVTNSRGGSISNYANYDVIIPYFPITAKLQFDRPHPTLADAQITVEGNFFNGTFGATDNSMTLSMKYRERNTETWTDVEVKPEEIQINGNTYTYSVYFSDGFPSDKQYEFAVVATDKLTSSNSNEALTAGKPVLWWNNEKVQTEKDLYVMGEKVIPSKNYCVVTLSSDYTTTRMNGKIPFDKIEQSDTTNELFTIYNNEISYHGERPILVLTQFGLVPEVEGQVKGVISDTTDNYRFPFSSPSANIFLFQQFIQPTFWQTRTLSYTHLLVILNVGSITFDSSQTKIILIEL